ncbi:MAG: hypothetical protein MZV63_37225 [Marinilabiliales bacterium]|nr:hypothetical protein [Marinilabiliales bacterium]
MTTASFIPGQASGEIPDGVSAYRRYGDIPDHTRGVLPADVPKSAAGSSTVRSFGQGFIGKDECRDLEFPCNIHRDF